MNKVPFNLDLESPILWGFEISTGAFEAAVNATASRELRVRLGFRRTP